MSISVVKLLLSRGQNLLKKEGEKLGRGVEMGVESILCLILHGDFGWRESIGLW